VNGLEIDTAESSIDTSLLLRLRVEQFLFEEAAILDEGRLDEWPELFTDDGRWIVPATDYRHGDGADSLVLLEDNLIRIRGRVTRLQSRSAHREYPRPRTRRLISNVRVVEDDGDELTAIANFVVYRFKNRDTHEFVGRYIYRLVRTGNSFRIRLRRTELDLEALDPHGTVSSIL
jgi:p-cumate 2,3-dioxygenase beta subunit